MQDGLAKHHIYGFHFSTVFSNQGTLGGTKGNTFRLEDGIVQLAGSDKSGTPLIRALKEKDNSLTLLYSALRCYAIHPGMFLYL